MENEYELPGNPVCPTCKRNQDAAFGRAQPRNGDYCICAYCASINRYSLVDGLYSVCKASEADFEVAKEHGIFYKLLAAQDLVRQMIVEKQNPIHEPKRRTS